MEHADRQAVADLSRRTAALERTIALLGAEHAIETTLPAVGRDGQIVLYQDATLAARGIVWPFRYNAASSSPYKWECIGGPWWTDTETSLSQVISTTTPTDLTSVSLAIPAALGAGDWQLQGVARFQNATNAHTTFLAGKIGSVTSNYMGTDRATTAGSDARGALAIGIDDYLGVAAGSTATLQMNLNSATAQITVLSASLAIRPIRVAGA